MKSLKELKKTVVFKDEPIDFKREGIWRNTVEYHKYSRYAKLSTLAAIVLIFLVMALLSLLLYFISNPLKTQNITKHKNEIQINEIGHK